jgi:SAM-dependent methyltransferase
MGLDIHALQFLKLIKDKKELKNTITIGRLSLHVEEKVIKHLLDIKKLYVQYAYSEQLLKEYFGASNVDSIDYSNFEQATFVHDFNSPLPKKFHNIYDSVINFGTLEHIFNFPQAIANCSSLCKVNGQLLHIFPANNFTGHGFYQFSPELFYRIYNEDNGYSETEVFITDLLELKKIYKILDVKEGRINIFSSNQLYLLVRTVLKRKDFCHKKIYQQDYLVQWNDNTSSNKIYEGGNVFKRIIKKFSFLYFCLSFFNKIFLKLVSKERLNYRNPKLKIIKLRKK